MQKNSRLSQNLKMDEISSTLKCMEEKKVGQESSKFYKDGESAVQPEKSETETKSSPSQESGESSEFLSSAQTTNFVSYPDPGK